jgi:hypothetical protein
LLGRPPDSSVLPLAGDDDLVPSEHIRAYLARWGPGIKVLYKPRELHGTFLLNPSYQDEILHSLAQVLA